MLKRTLIMHRRYQKSTGIIYEIPALYNTMVRTGDLGVLNLWDTMLNTWDRESKVCFCVLSPEILVTPCLSASDSSSKMKSIQTYRMNGTWAVNSHDPPDLPWVRGQEPYYLGLGSQTLKVTLGDISVTHL